MNLEIDRIISVLFSGRADVTDAIKSLGYSFRQGTPFGGALYEKAGHELLFTVEQGTLAAVTYYDKSTNKHVDLVRGGRRVC